MSAICLIDTSVFMEILNVPGKASHHKKTADLRYFNWLTSGYNQWSRTTTTETQSARRTHRELYYSITHSKQLGTKTSSVPLQTSSVPLQTSSHLLQTSSHLLQTSSHLLQTSYPHLQTISEHLERLELRHPGKPTHPDQGYRAKNRIPEQEARK